MAYETHLSTTNKGWANDETSVWLLSLWEIAAESLSYDILLSEVKKNTLDKLWFNNRQQGHIWNAFGSFDPGWPGVK